MSIDSAPTRVTEFESKTSQSSEVDQGVPFFFSDVFRWFCVGIALIVGIPLALYAGAALLPAVGGAAIVVAGLAAKYCSDLGLKAPRMNVSLSASRGTTFRISQSTRFGTLSKSFKLK